VLRCEDLVIRQGGFVLSARITVPAGARIAVVGPSGAGKSTLFGAIAGFVGLSSGRITWQGARFDRSPPWQRPVSILFQDGNLFPHLNAADNVALALSPRLRPSPSDRARVRLMLAQVGLGDLADRRPGELSGGQQSRVALARILLAERPVVLLDEPFAALGPGLKEEMLDLALRLLTDAGRTVLLVTHDPEEAARLDGGLVTVAEGRAEGPFPTAATLSDPPPGLRAWLGRRERPAT
jgi:thiamine transport system ATP-binding protein